MRVTRTRTWTAACVLASVALTTPALAQPIAHQESLLAPASGLAAHGGAAIAIDGDYALVGVPGTGSATTRGTVYIYHRTASATWMLDQTMADPEPSASGAQDMFGASIALVGTTAIVGDPGHASSSGQAWLVTRGTSASSWTATRIAPPTGAPTRFGASVAIVSIDAAGNTISAIGAPDGGAGRAGAVFLFDATGAALAMSPMTPATVMGGDLFGASVALYASSTTAVSVMVGAPGADQVYAFELAAGSSTSATFTAPSTGKFGAAVAISPSGLVAVIGAHQVGSGGAAYLLERATTTVPWPDIGTATMLVAADTAASDHFGSSVAAGNDAVVVGAPNHDGSGGMDIGRAYLFLSDGPMTWRERSGYEASGAMPGDQLGASVAISGTTVMAGAPRPMGTLGYAAEFPFPLAQGAACSMALAERCESGFCVDGVCCESACGGGATDDCVGCAMSTGSSADGTCGPSRASMSCMACGTSGMCDLSGMCSAAVGCDAGSPDVDTGTPGTDGGSGGDDVGPRVVHHISGCKCEVGHRARSPWIALAGLATLVGLRARRRSRRGSMIFSGRSSRCRY